MAKGRHHGATQSATECRINPHPGPDEPVCEPWGRLERAALAGHAGGHADPVAWSIGELATVALGTLRARIR
jgi:hypothetical protein